MRVDIVSKEYPPEIYGGAGVHVTELVAALRGSIEVQVRAFGADRDEKDTTSYRVPAELAGANGALQTLGIDSRLLDEGTAAAEAPGGSALSAQAGNRCGAFAYQRRQPGRRRSVGGAAAARGPEAEAAMFRSQPVGFCYTDVVFLA